MKRQTLAGAVGVFASIVLDIFLQKSRFCKRYGAPHSTGGKKLGSFGPAFDDFSMFTSTYDC